MTKPMICLDPTWWNAPDGALPWDEPDDDPPQDDTEPDEDETEPAGDCL